jgi:N-acetylglucosaminyldiphosphoundecaprenol N-acetyl-beta-D-mannosaminyltransferase
MELNEIEAFGIKIHPIGTEEFLGIINDSIQKNKPLVQSGVNASSIVELKKSSELAEAYNNADLINIDGMSMVWALRFLGYTVPERVACPDLADEVMKMAVLKGFKLFLFGAKEEKLLAAIENIKASHKGLEICGWRNGYYNTEDEVEIVKSINNSKADILFLGMPSPQKEVFVEKYKSQLNVKYILGVGGFFDILSGSIKRAPEWAQNIGMEWFYRLVQEPKRLFTRYFKGNLQFIRLVLAEKHKHN